MIGKFGIVWNHPVDYNYIHSFINYGFLKQSRSKKKKIKQKIYFANYQSINQMRWKRKIYIVRLFINNNNN